MSEKVDTVTVCKDCKSYSKPKCTLTGNFVARKFTCEKGVKK